MSFVKILLTKLRPRKKRYIYIFTKGAHLIKDIKAISTKAFFRYFEMKLIKNI